ncbi:MAG: two-component system response regulator [marine bacterium B5-7]|nr:MAG: two-component system response regulator [marine bacterium B5-7]
MMLSSLSNVAESKTSSIIYIVDDESVSRMLLSKTIENINSGITVKSFQSAPAALAALETSPPDLIITDYKMPIMDGVEFTKRIRRLHNCKDIPIIMITIIDDRSVLYDALKCGVTEFLNKPFDKVECEARCKNLLALGKRQTKLKQRSFKLEKKISETTEEIHIREKETLIRLTRACGFKDCVTGEHLLRIGRISKIIALELGFDETFSEILETSSPLHDIGKLAIPDNILMKKGKLTEQEFDVMKTHTTIGHEILKDSPSPYLQTGALIALNHHEKYDGSGYPNKIPGKDIPIEARIVTVADVFDSLSNHRPYKKAWPINKTIDYLVEQQGQHLDPECVKALMSRVDDVKLPPQKPQ